jgi:methyltransferase family protein
MKQFLKRQARRVINRIAVSLENVLLEPQLVQYEGGTHLASLDVRRFAQLRAAWDAAGFYNRHLYNAEFFPSAVDQVRAMASRAATLGEGLFLEFGVASGTTIRAIAASGRRITGFDTFTGLLEDWREGLRAGAFACNVPEVPANVEFKIGLIQNTLPAFLAENPEPIRFLHIDTDLYAPANLILMACKPRIQRAIIVFDELFNYAGWEDHEYKAFAEFMQNSPEFSVKYLGLGGATAVSVLLERRPG